MLSLNGIQIARSLEKSIMLDKWSGKKCYMLGARELLIAWQGNPQYWEWGPIPESGFPEVDILRKVCWLEIRGKMATEMLSEKTTYAACLVFRIANDYRGLAVPANTMVSFAGTSNVYLKKQGAWHVPVQENERIPEKRKDGWMEIELGEFYYNEGDFGEVEMIFKEVRQRHWKRGLIVEGIEL